MRGVDVLLEVLATEGVVHVFGNPGTTELPFIDEVARSSTIEFVLVLHEAVAVTAAEGYARASGRPAFVSLHTAPGLGNALGVLANTKVTGTPMVITAGQQHRGHLFMEPFLSGPLVEMARPLTKWAYEVRSLDDLGPAMRRAFNEAQSPPTGPVFVSIPMDVLDEEGADRAPAPSRIDRRTVPADVSGLATALTSVPGGQLVIVAGDEVAASGGVTALSRVAEALGSPVYGTPMHASTVFPTAHELWRGALPADAALMRDILSRFEALFLIGGRGLMTFLYRPVSSLPPGLEVIHLSSAPEDLGRFYPTSLGVVGDPATTLATVLTAIYASPADPMEGELTPGSAARAEPDARSRGAAAGPIDPVDAVRILIDGLPADAAIVDEAVTSDPLIRSALRIHELDRFYYSRGGGLGWGIGASVGVSLARDHQRVVCLSGDGSALFGIQAMWTAANQRVPVTIAVLNNGQYLILRRFLRELGAAGAAAGMFAGLDIDDPPIDFVSLARGFGVDGCRVDHPDALQTAYDEALARDAPFLLDVHVEAPIES